MVTGKRDGNVVVIPYNIGTNQPIPIASYSDELPPDAFPLTMTVQEAQGKFGKDLVLFEAPKQERKPTPGVAATEDDITNFYKENQVDIVKEFEVKPKGQPQIVKPVLNQTPEFIDTAFIDSCIKRAIQNEIETYEIAQKYASGKKAKEILVIVKALKDFMDRIENGKKN